MNRSRWQIILLAIVAMALGLLIGHARVASAEEVLDEAGAIAVLGSDAPWLDKQTACRRLRQIGTAQSVPALAALLTDETLSHLARYALEPMACAEAGAALRDALAVTQGPQKAGVVISLGARRDTEAAPLLVALTGDPNVDIARAAIGALGRIATAEAVGTLEGLWGASDAAMEPALAEALLVASERLTERGESDRAVALCASLLDSAAPMAVRMGAFHGLAYARPAEAPDRMIAALGGDDPVFRGMAAQVVAETAGADATQRYCGALAGLPADGQVALLRGLADRGDPTARQAVSELVSSTDPLVKIAAITALGALGNAADVPALSALLVSDNAEVAAAARASLTSIEGEEVDAAIAAAMPSAPPAVRAELVALLANRRAADAVALAAQALADGDAAVRKAGLDALGLLAGTEQIPGILAVIVGTTDPDERSAAEKALNAVGQRAGDAALPLVLGAMAGAHAEARMAFLRSAARLGGAGALEMVVAAIDDDDTSVSGEAVRLLSTWPTIDAAPHLRKLAESADLSRQVLGLRGYVKMAQLEPAAEKKAAMLVDAMALVQRPEEKKAVLAAWGTVPAAESLGVLLPNLDDAVVRNEAASAIIAVAAELGKAGGDAKVKAVEALQAVIERCDDAAIREAAQKAVTDLG